MSQRPAEERIADSHPGKPLRSAAFRRILSFGAGQRANSSKSREKPRDKAGIRLFQPNLRDACGISFKNLVDCK